MRDVALNMFWVGRYALTMYEKRPTRWRDVPRRRTDVFMPIVTPWEDGDRKVAAVKSATTRCHRPGMPRPRTASSPSFSTCSGTASTTPPSYRRSSRRSPTSWPTPRTSPSGSTATTRTSRSSARRHHRLCRGRPELEALHRWAMVLHNQYPWDRSQAELVEVGELDDDDYVVAFHPRNRGGSPLPATARDRATSAASSPRPRRRSRRSGPIPRSTCASSSR